MRPLGFSVSSRMLKRSGLDYWPQLGVEIIDDLSAYLEQSKQPFYFFSRYADRLYTEVSYTQAEDALLIFGSETAGLPASFKERWPDRFLTIPCSPIFREKNPLDSGCLNLSNAVSIVLYEALRQQNFKSCL